MLTVFKKNSLKPNTASHNNATWYIDTDGFLEHSPSRGSLYYKEPALQKTLPVLGGPHHIYLLHHPCFLISYINISKITDVFLSPGSDISLNLVNS